MKGRFYESCWLDTTPRWFWFSLIYAAFHLTLHAAMNGWLPFFYPGHNFYNAPSTAWIGSYPFDPMHLSAGFTVAALLFNFSWGQQKRSYMLIPVLFTLVAISWVSLGWEMAEYVVYVRNTSGFIQVGLLDTLWDELMNSVGAIIAVLLGEHFT